MSDYIYYQELDNAEFIPMQRDDKSKLPASDNANHTELNPTPNDVTVNDEKENNAHKVGSYILRTIM